MIEDPDYASRLPACSLCGEQTEVLATRGAKRDRRCMACKHRFKTFEIDAEQWKAYHDWRRAQRAILDVLEKR